MTRISTLAAAVLPGILALAVAQPAHAATPTPAPARHLIECSTDQQKVYVAYAYSDVRHSGNASVTTCLNTNEVNTEAAIRSLEDSLSMHQQRQVVILNMIRLDR
ncbi:MAG: hypothetical protein LBV73_29650 [Paraburkholderia sp.]|nr:hypothetical protein [Paraburkholderia sp.]